MKLQRDTRLSFIFHQRVKRGELISHLYKKNINELLSELHEIGYRNKIENGIEKHFKETTNQQRAGHSKKTSMELHIARKSRT